MEKIAYNGIDVMKFIMAIVIISIHTQIYTVLGRWYLVFQDHAVPLFFLFSSYFFFKSLNKANTGKEKWKLLLHFEKRINLLYIFWIIVLMPAILYWWHSEYLQLPIIELLLRFIKEYFFGSQFGAAWFFGSLIVAMPIVFCMVLTLSHFNKGWVILLLIALLIYIYINECEDSSLYTFYAKHFRSPKLSFPVALWWLTLGYLFTNEKVDCFLSWLNTKRSISLWVFSFTFGCIFPEIRYLTIIVGVIALFALSRNMRLKDNSALYYRLRIYSIHIFAMHFTVIFVVSYFLREHAIMIFIVTLLLCISISEILIRLMRYSPFKLLKYSK